MYKQGDIILIPYPFTDLSTAKQRPAVIISNEKSNNFRGDYIVAKVTSVIRNDDFSFTLSSGRLDHPIPRPSEVRTNELLTVSKEIIKRNLLP
ncbi:MAG: type II toxin-antitoxin system PemK/MazF family toxin [Bacteroidota bacterium]